MAQVRAPGAHDPYAALRLPAFRRFVASVLTLTVATQIQAVVVGWQIYAVTKDPLSLGLVGLAEALPFITIALFAGHVADRVDRRRVAALATVAMLGCAAALLAFTLIPGTLPGRRVWPIYAVIFASGIARSFLQPSRQALGAEPPSSDRRWADCCMDLEDRLWRTASTWFWSSLPCLLSRP